MLMAAQHFFEYVLRFLIKIEALDMFGKVGANSSPVLVDIGVDIFKCGKVIQFGLRKVAVREHTQLLTFIHMLTGYAHVFEEW